MTHILVRAVTKERIQTSTQSSLELPLTTLFLIYCVRFHVTAPNRKPINLFMRATRWF